MPRMMSFSMTTPQFVDGSKDVTRRWGWSKLKAGDELVAVEKAMGLKKGEKVKKLGRIKIVSVRIERLDRMIHEPAYGADELRREGYPFGLKCSKAFVERLASAGKKKPSDHITRIEFERIPV